jgi:hypothetical protein
MAAGTSIRAAVVVGGLSEKSQLQAMGQLLRLDSVAIQNRLTDV